MGVLMATVILVASLLGIAMILFRKIPALVGLPEQETRRQPKFFSILKKRIGNNSLLKSISLEVFLQKILSKIRVLTLKLENKTALWLQRLREKAQKRKMKEKDNYWERIRKLKKGK